MNEPAQESAVETLDPLLLDLLRCPHCVSGKLHNDIELGRLSLHRDAWLVSETCDRKYPIRDGIPVMMVEEGEKWAQVEPASLPVPPSEDR